LFFSAAAARGERLFFRTIWRLKKKRHHFYRKKNGRRKQTGTGVNGIDPRPKPLKNSLTRPFNKR
jgi:hypothetical protein